MLNLFQALVSGILAAASNVSRSGDLTRTASNFDNIDYNACCRVEQAFLRNFSIDIFFPADYLLRKNAISHRGNAIGRLKPLLEDLLKRK